jgi:MFS family permease
MMKSKAQPAKFGKLFINRNFALLWCGQAISILGDIVFTTTLTLWIAAQVARGQPWAPLAVSGALLATYLPTLLLGPPAGVFVDRWDKRRTMITMDIIRAITMLLLLAITFMLSPSSGPMAAIGLLSAIYVVTGILSAADRFFRPAMLTLIGDIVEAERREQAMGLGQLSVSLATIAGPPLAALLYFSIGVRWLLLINTASFVISFLSVSLIRAPRADHPSGEETSRAFLHEFLSGLRYIARDRILVPLVCCTMMAMLGGSALNALDIFFLTQNLHASPNLYGVMDMALGMGTMVGALLAAVFAARVGKLRTIWSSLVLIGLLLVVYSRMTSFLPASILLFIIGCPLAAISVVSGPLILRIVSRAFVGRVSSTLEQATTLASIVGTFLAGYLASSFLYHFHAMFLGIRFSSVDTIILAGGLLVIASGYYAFLRFRHARVSTE